MIAAPLLAAVLCVGLASPAVDAPDTVYEAVVTGMSCGGCKREVKDILTKLENVKAVDCADWKTGKVTITMNGAKTLAKSTVEAAFKGTKFGLTSLTEKAAESKPARG
jgi:copper chaperone CopZ